MTRSDAFWLAFSGLFGCFSVASLLAGGSLWHLAALAVHVACVVITLLVARVRHRSERSLRRLAAARLRVSAWRAVLLDRNARGSAGVFHAWSGFHRALDLAYSEVARA